VDHEQRSWRAALRLAHSRPPPSSSSSFLSAPRSTLLPVSYTQLARSPYRWARDMVTHLGIHTPWDECELMQRPLPSRQARTPLRSRVSGLADDVLAELSTHPRYRLGLGRRG
jgi:hypothetical protein